MKLMTGEQRTATQTKRRRKRHQSDPVGRKGMKDRRSNSQTSTSSDPIGQDIARSRRQRHKRREGNANQSDKRHMGHEE